MKQTKLFVESKQKRKFGGSLLKGRKTQRPLSTRESLHLVLRSKEEGGEIYFSPYDEELHALIRKAADRYNIRIYRFSLNWTHIHFVIFCMSRESYNNFVRYVTAQIVAILSRRHGRNLKGLFELRPYTRIVSWGRDFKNAVGYADLNVLESMPSIEELTRLDANRWRAGR